MKPVRLLNPLLLALAIGAWFLLPTDLAFLTRLLIMMLFVLSIDLVLGYAGIATLGQAAMFGTGAYAAGIFATQVSADPLLGLLVGAVSAAAVAALSGLLLLRTHGLTLLMLSIAVAQVLQEIANKAKAWTGGADGLGGIVMDPLLGRFEFDLYGETGYLYALAVLAVCFWLSRRLVASNLGLAARGIRESVTRMRAIGSPVQARLLTLYTIAGAMAGLAGALSAQTTELVGLNSFDFALSAEAVIMLILGGAGRLYGALIGTLLFMWVHHVASAIDPFNWLFVIGAMVLGVVFFAPSGLITVIDALGSRWRKSP